MKIPRIFSINKNTISATRKMEGEQDVAKEIEEKPEEKPSEEPEISQKDFESIDLTSCEDGADLSTTLEDIEMADSEAGDDCVEVTEKQEKQASTEGATGGRDTIDEAYSKQHNIQHHVYPNDLNLKLIEAVKKYPVLYDHQHEFFRNLVHKQQAWLEIEEQIGLKRSDCKNRFRTYQQRFAVVYSALHNQYFNKEKKDEILRKKFIYYDDMLFFKDYVDMERIDQSIANRIKKSRRDRKKHDKKVAAAAAAKEEKIRKIQPPSKSFNFVRERAPQVPPQRMDHNFGRRTDCPPQFPMNHNMSNNTPHCPPGQYGQQFPQGQPNWNFPVAPVQMMQQMCPPPSMPPMQPTQQQRPPQNKDSMIPDDAHIDFFFRSIAQQVKKSNITDRSFLDLQSRILNALTFKLYGLRG